MEYKTGSYVVVGRKNWVCEKCHKRILFGAKQFIRVTCFGPVKQRSDGKDYQEKIYERYHIECALELIDLNDYEHTRLGEYFKTAQPAQEGQKQPSGS